MWRRRDDWVWHLWTRGSLDQFEPADLLLCVQFTLGKEESKSARIFQSGKVVADISAMAAEAATTVNRYWSRIGTETVPLSNASSELTGPVGLQLEFSYWSKELVSWFVFMELQQDLQALFNLECRKQKLSSHTVWKRRRHIMLSDFTPGMARNLKSLKVQLLSQELASNTSIMDMVEAYGKCRNKALYWRLQSLNSWSGPPAFSSQWIFGSFSSKGNELDLLLLT